MEENEVITPPEGESTPPAAEDPLKNVKAEFNRKYGNLEETTKALQAQLASLNAKLTPAPAATPNKRVSVFENEEAYANQIAEEVDRRVDAKLAARDNYQQKYQATTSHLVTEFPELNDIKSPLMVRAQELFKGLPEEDRNSPLAMKTAVTEAALELGVKPMSKRSKEDESFSLGSGAGATKKPAKSSEVTEADEYLARALGVKIEDPKVRERIKAKHNGRKYNKWG